MFVLTDVQNVHTSSFNLHFALRRLARDELIAMDVLRRQIRLVRLERKENNWYRHLLYDEMMWGFEVGTSAV